MKKESKLFPVSVVVVTKDEENNIEDALKSVSDAQEIVIVDSFSTDRTVEICRKYTDKVFQQEWLGYARQKQLAVDNAVGPWVLVLDADERVTPELKQEIIEKITLKSKISSISHITNKGERELNGFYIPRKNYFLGKWIRHSGWWPDYTLRLFRKDMGRFDNREVHEKIIIEGKTEYLKNPLEHFTYRNISEFLKKMDIYATLSAKEMLKKNTRNTAGFTIIVKSLFTFFKMYILRRGFLDGMYGLLLAVFYSYYTFLKYAKLWEERKLS